MVQLIKKGGLRERANRSRSYLGSENTEKTLAPNIYRDHQRQSENIPEPTSQQQSTASTDQTDLQSLPRP